MPGAYYNEFDPGAAAWLRELIRHGQIAEGEVDERSILDVRAEDLRDFTQCHFFAGIGGWSYALRLAGWPDDRPCWTGSPPCQPFSAAGRQLGRDDARHLAPHFVDLVRAGRPAVLFGEQVASAEVFGKAASGTGKRAAAPPAWAWIDDLSDRLEAARYAVGASDFPSAGVGAPHIRQRTFFGAISMADADHAGLEGRGQPGRERADQCAAGQDGLAGRLADAEGADVGGCPQPGYGDGKLGAQGASNSETGRLCSFSTAIPLHVFWSDADWLFCRDGKWRPVEPGTFPLAHGVSGRVGLLRGYGNAINPHAAAQFIQAFDAALQCRDRLAPLRVDEDLLV